MNSQTKKRHRHYFRLIGVMGCGGVFGTKFSKAMAKRMKIEEDCRCKEKRSRAPSYAEAKKIWQKLYDHYLHTTSMYKLWFDFRKRFMCKGGFKYKGYRLRCKVDRWAAKNPEVIISTCDDGLFMSSVVVFIPCANNKEYMGTNVISIPQAGDPSELFFYPHHLTELKTAVQTLSARTKKLSNYKRRSPI